MASAAAVGTTAVFQEGPHKVKVKHVYGCEVSDLPKPLMVVTPADAGVYPVAVFLPGFNMLNYYYQSLLSHVASHGFIVVAPQLYWITVNPYDVKEIEATRQVAAWLAGERPGQGLAYVLRTAFGLDDVEPDLTKLALAGHSRGGDTAFAVASGLGGDPAFAEALRLGGASSPPPEFSALVGVDPVAGIRVPFFFAHVNMQVEPKVLTHKPSSIDTGMPVLVIGTGKGPDGFFPCAPDKLNHAEFYDECKPTPSKYHFVAKDYGHQDMLDDGLPAFGCVKSDDHHSKDDARKAMGGLIVAFLRKALLHTDVDLKAVLDNPGLAPAVLDPVEYECSGSQPSCGKEALMWQTNA